MCSLKSLSREGLEEMAATSAEAQRRYWALGEPPPTLSAKCQPIRSGHFKWNCVVDARAQSHDRDIMMDRVFCGYLANHPGHQALDQANQ